MIRWVVYDGDGGGGLGGQVLYRHTHLINSALIGRINVLGLNGLTATMSGSPSGCFCGISNTASICRRTRGFVYHQYGGSGLVREKQWCVVDRHVCVFRGRVRWVDFARMFDTCDGYCDGYGQTAQYSRRTKEQGLTHDTGQGGGVPKAPSCMHVIVHACHRAAVPNACA